MSRKAQALPMNTVIIAILVVLVLFVVGAFFLGGTGGIMKTIRQIFGGSVGGQDMVFAVQTCNHRCESLKLLPVDSIPKSAYCDQPFLIDSNKDGEADFTTGKDGKKVYKRHYCFKEEDGDEETISLNVPCALDNGHGPSDFCAKGYKGKPEEKAN